MQKFLMFSAFCTLVTWAFASGVFDKNAVTGGPGQLEIFDGPDYDNRIFRAEGGASITGPAKFFGKHGIVVLEIPAGETLTIEEEVH